MTAKRTTRTAANTLSRFTESATSAASVRVDRDKGVIYGVKILGRHSKNGREYSDAALDQAVKLYEGAKVNVDHPARNRPGEPIQDRGLMERFGVLRSVRREGDSVHGDLHYFKSSASTEQILEMAEKCPETFGLSHNAEGKTTTRNGRVIVETLHKVHSVDVVDDPATTAGLFESTNHEAENVQTTIGKILESAARDKVAKATPLYKVLHEVARATDADGKASVLLEMEGADMPVVDVPMEAPAEAKPEDQLKDALLALIKAKLDSADEAALQTVLSALGLEDSVTAAVKGGGGKSESKGGDATESTKESVQKGAMNNDATSKENAELRERVEKLEGQLSDRDMTDHCKAMLESLNRDLVDPNGKTDRIKALKRMGDDKERRELIESWPARVDPTKIDRPRFSPPARPAGQQLTESYTPKNGKELAELLR